MMLVTLRQETYEIHNVDALMTPALLIYPEIVDANIRATLKMAGGDPNRWRPHIKTAKMSTVLRRYLAHGVKNFKCSTTLELSVACSVGAADVLLAFPVMGANARAAREIGDCFPGTRVSVLVESLDQARVWRGTGIGMFIDVNSGMNRTGIDQQALAEIVELARKIGRQFRGVHYYDGHIAGLPSAELERRAHEGYDRLLQIVEALEANAVRVEEVITSGTPASPFALTYPRFRNAAFLHRISPGTVVFNDRNSLEQLPGFGYQPAALVLATVISRPAAHWITCDAGHKSVSADAGVPTCAVIGHADWIPGKPSEEHLPIQIPPDAKVALGEKLYLLPQHVCPTVNNFDEAVLIANGQIQGITSVTARGHQSTAAAAGIAV